MRDGRGGTPGRQGPKSEGRRPRAGLPMFQPCLPAKEGTLRLPYTPGRACLLFLLHHLPLLSRLLPLPSLRFWQVRGWQGAQQGHSLVGLSSLLCGVHPQPVLFACVGCSPRELGSLGQACCHVACHPCLLAGSVPTSGGVECRVSTQCAAWASAGDLPIPPEGRGPRSRPQPGRPSPSVAGIGEGTCH